MGIEQAADRTHSFKLVSAELLAHILEAAASVLTGKAPAEFERCVIELVMGRRRAARPYPRQCDPGRAHRLRS